VSHRRPHRFIVRFEGIAYEKDLDAIRAALVRRQIEGEFRGRMQLADAVGCSRSTVSRFFGVTQIQTGLPTTLALLEKLHLTFDDVFRRCPEHDSSE
jgi:hypothetical protein